MLTSVLLAIIVVVSLGAFTAAVLLTAIRLPTTRPRSDGLGFYFRTPLMDLPLDDPKKWKRYRKAVSKQRGAGEAPAPFSPAVDASNTTRQGEPGPRSARHLQRRQARRRRS